MLRILPSSLLPEPTSSCSPYHAGSGGIIDHFLPTAQASTLAAAACLSPTLALLEATHFTYAHQHLPRSDSRPLLPQLL